MARTSRYINLAIEALRAGKPMTGGELGETVGTSRRTGRRLMRRLIEDGVVEPAGQEHDAGDFPRWAFAMMPRRR